MALLGVQNRRNATPNDLPPQPFNFASPEAAKPGAYTVNLEIGELRKVLNANDAWLPFVGKYRKLKERTDVGMALSPEQERVLLQATSAIDSACHTATVLCWNTAMRSDEIRRLRWSQIDLEKRTLVVG